MKNLGPPVLSRVLVTKSGEMSEARIGEARIGRLEETATRAGLLGPDLGPEALLKNLGLILRTMRNEALGVGSASITSTRPLSEE